MTRRKSNTARIRRLLPTTTESGENVLSRCRVTGALPVETRSNSVTSGAPRNLDASEGREGFPGQMFTFAGKTRPGPEGATARCRKSGSKFPPISPTSSDVRDH